MCQLKAAVFFLLGGFCALSVQADVYLPQPINQQQLADLSSLLPSSLRPGGTRRLTINGSELIATRHIVKNREDFFEAITHDMRLRYQAYPERHFDYQALDDSIQVAFEAEQGPVRDQAKAEAITLVDSLVAQERERIITAFELPFSYRAGIWRVFGRVPIAAIDPSNSLAETPVTEGYLMFSEETMAKKPFYDLWELKFGEGFRLLDILGTGEGDAVGDDLEIVRRLPSSRRTLTYEERADHWLTKTWSYEAIGSVDTALQHYVSELEQAGYSSRLAEIDAPGERLAFLKGKEQEIVVHILDTGKKPRPLQVTIQRYPI